MSEINSVIINNEKIVLDGCEPSDTLLDWLREERELKGSKEGCAEGDCGACSVLISPVLGGRPRPVNACLLRLGQIEGSEITTIEGLGDSQYPHPIQKAISENSGSQCGFCTPGIVIALTGLINKEIDVNEDSIHDALAGNLCRCTGYKPIINSVKEKSLKNSKLKISKKWNTKSKFSGNKSVFFHPKTVSEAIKLASENHKAKFISGGTDLNLQLSSYEGGKFIQLTQIHELLGIEKEKRSLCIGAAVSLEDSLPVFDQFFEPLANIIRRFGSSQIRTQATLAGNLCTASPIGDGAPCLMALNAEVKIATFSGIKNIAVEDLFTDYRKTVLGPSDIIVSINIPYLSINSKFFAWKISKRYDQDISTISMAAVINTGDNGIITSCRVCFGGLSKTPIRSRNIENILIGTLPEDNLKNKLKVVEKEFNPITDLRGGSEYRKNACLGLMKRLIHTLNNPNSDLEVIKVKGF